MKLITCENTPKVTGFLGQQNRRHHPAERGRPNCESGAGRRRRPKPVVVFEIGEQVRVCDGPFATFSGLVEEVDEERRGSKWRCLFLAGQLRSNLSTGRSKRADRCPWRQSKLPDHGP